MTRTPAKQTRRSISVRGTTYDALKKCCEQDSRSMSDVVEELLAGYFARKGAQVGAARPTADRPPQAETQAQPARGTAGRPAPTPAAVVLGTKKQKSNDYRAFQF